MTKTNDIVLSFVQMLMNAYVAETSCNQLTKPHLTNAHTAILHEAFIAGAYKRAKCVCTGGVFWTGSIDLTFIYICGELR